MSEKQHAEVMQEHLEPCPFCGGNAYYTETVNGTSLSYVGCAACGIAFEAALVPGAAPNQVQWSKDIKAAWNRRDYAAAEVERKATLAEHESRERLLEAARWYRQHVYDLENQLNVVRHTELGGTNG